MIRTLRSFPKTTHGRYELRYTVVWVHDGSDTIQTTYAGRLRWWDDTPRVMCGEWR